MKDFPFQVHGSGDDTIALITASMVFWIVSRVEGDEANARRVRRSRYKYPARPWSQPYTAGGVSEAVEVEVELDDMIAGRWEQRTDACWCECVAQA